MRDRAPCSKLLVVAVTGAAIAACDHRVIPTDPDPGEYPAASATAAVTGGSPPLPARIDNLPTSELLRTVLVEFPEPGQVGVCHTQVASRGRPVPFRVHRLQVELPEEAWVEAEGRVAYVQYRRFGRNGFVLRVARCVVPASLAAVNRLFDRFSIHGSARTSRSGVSGLGMPTSELTSRWEVVPLTERPSGGLGVPAGLVLVATSTEDDSGCVEDNSQDNPCELDEAVVDGSDCTNPYHDRNEDGVCECANGSDEPDCWIDPAEPPPEGPGDCDFEPCGGGGGGSGGDGHLEQQQCLNCRDLAELEFQKMLAATDYICLAGRSGVRNALSAGEFGLQTHSWVTLRGWHHKRYHPDELGSSSHHYSLNTNHPGWTGVRENQQQIGAIQQLIELAGTMVHEYFHHEHPGEFEHQIEARVKNCVAGYLGT